jgi:hypothetical protein
MNKTDDILEKLKNAPQPQIDNPEEIADRIMGSLGPVPAAPKEKEKGSGMVIKFLPIVRTVLSVAAMWILGFFIYLQYDVAAPTAKTNLVPPKGGWEGASTLREVYKYCLCQDCKKTISYTQIKSKLYENH